MMNIKEEKFNEVMKLLDGIDFNQEHLVKIVSSCMNSTYNNGYHQGREDEIGGVL